MSNLCLGPPWTTLNLLADTGAQCDIVPVDLYKKATKDLELLKVRSLHMVSPAYPVLEIRYSKSGGVT